MRWLHQLPARRTRSRSNATRSRARELREPQPLRQNNGLIEWPQELTGRLGKLLSAIPRLGGMYEIAKSSCALLMDDVASQGIQVEYHKRLKELATVDGGT